LRRPAIAFAYSFFAGAELPTGNPRERANWRSRSPALFIIFGVLLFGFEARGNSAGDFMALSPKILFHASTAGTGAHARRRRNTTSEHCKFGFVTSWKCASAFHAQRAMPNSQRNGDKYYDRNCGDDERLDLPVSPVNR
jgi:hypothetical protein